jgi:hypothetical protein
MDEKKFDALDAGIEKIEATTPEAMQAQAKADEAQAARGTAADQAKAWAVIPQMLGGFVCMIAPELAACYTEEKCLQWGERMVPVAEKRGWDAGPDSLPEIALIASTLGFAIPTFVCVKRKLAAAKAAADEARTVENTATQPAGGAT